jgi:hypothetical protein
VVLPLLTRVLLCPAGWRFSGRFAIRGRLALTSGADLGAACTDRNCRSSDADDGGIAEPLG